jgi:photosystem II stability/assembly factor-like uncharacterized protein
LAKLNAHGGDETDMVIALSHGGTTEYASLTRSTEMLVGTVDGVVIMEREAGGSAWRVLDRSLSGSHVRAIIFEPESGLTFAGGYGSSVHVSADYGRTWKRSGDGLSEDDVWSLGAVRLHGRVRLYAGTQPPRLFYSDDMGQHWRELPGVRNVPSIKHWTFPGPPHIAHLKHLSFDPDDAATMYASIEVGALLKSTDAGETWREMHGFYQPTAFNRGTQGELAPDVHRTVIHPRDGKRMYVVGGEGLCLWMTSNGGNTWDQLTDYEHPIGGYPDCLVLNPRQPNVMFVAAAHRSPTEHRESGLSGTRISRSLDGGRTWEVLTAGLPDRLAPRIEALALEDWGDGFSVFAGTWAGEIYASQDGGEQWSQIVKGIPAISKGTNPPVHGILRR